MPFNGTTRDPDTMTADQRRDEVASVLARGVIRAVRIARSRSMRDMDPPGDSSGSGLELSPDAGLSVAVRPAG